MLKDNFFLSLTIRIKYHISIFLVNSEDKPNLVLVRILRVPYMEFSTEESIY